MNLIPAKCTNCGASLTVYPNEDAAICPFCNTPFIIQKAINYYTQNNTIKADTVNIYGGQAEFFVRGGRLERYNGNSTEVIIPNNVITIGADAFESCVGIKKIVIPCSVEEIELRTLTETDDWGSRKKASALCECKRLETVEFANGMKIIPKLLFYGLTYNFSVIFPNTITEIGAGAFGEFCELTNIRLPDSIRIIHSNAFTGSRGLTNFVLPASLEVIGAFAFLGCSDLKEIIIPKNVRSINGHAFESCYHLESVELNDNLEKIGEQAFYVCRSLKAIEIPNSVKIIEAEAFCSCRALKSVNIWGSNVSIASKAFYECDSLSRVNIRSNNISIDANAFGEHIQIIKLCPDCGGKITVFGKCKQCRRKFI